jgi:hypothetical protein
MPFNFLFCFGWFFIVLDVLKDISIFSTFTYFGTEAIAITKLLKKKISFRTFNTVKKPPKIRRMPSSGVWRRVDVVD